MKVKRFNVDRGRIDVGISDVRPIRYKCSKVIGDEIFECRVDDDPSYGVIPNPNRVEFAIGDNDKFYIVNNHLFVIVFSQQTYEFHFYILKNWEIVEDSGIIRNASLTDFFESEFFTDHGIQPEFFEPEMIEKIEELIK
jgi:hypothetical protein